MKPIKVADRTQRELNAMPPEKRAKIEAILARNQTPEANARRAEQYEILRRELEETGRVATIAPEDFDKLKSLFDSLRQSREAQGLSLSDVAARTGMDKAVLSRLENGQQMNPTISTLTRLSRALGKTLVWSLQDATEA